MDFKKKKSLIFKILIGVVIIGLILLLVFFVYKFNNNSKNNDDITSTKETIDDNYIYKIRFDFGCETYIYLLEDKAIKTVAISEIYDIVPDCNCMEPTGEYDYDETIIDFSQEAKNMAIDVFDELYEASGTKEIDTTDMSLTKNQQRILLAIVLDNEDDITIENNLKYETSEEKFNTSNNDYQIINTKTLLNNTTNNKIVNNIANYLNEIVNNDYKEINNEIQNLIETTNITNNYNISSKLELTYVGPYSISFVYTTEGKLGSKNMYNIKGYTFNYNGDIEEFDMNGWKDKYYNAALDSFMQTELYLNNKEQLDLGWSTTLYDNMYLIGNWYLSDDKLIFLIPAELLGFEENIAKVVKIEVDVDEEF